jgi:hypothetical protein
MDVTHTSTPAQTSESAFDTRELLTLDQHTSTEQIFISISGLIGTAAVAWHETASLLGAQQRVAGLL